MRQIYHKSVEAGRDMLLVIDIGNTNVTCGVFDGDDLSTTFRISSTPLRTSDEYGIVLTQLLKGNGIRKENITGAIVASVVPAIMHAFMGAISRYIGVNPLLVGPGIKTGIKLTNANPAEIGADRIVDVVAAYAIYGGPVLVLDFGTATTYDYVTENGEFGVGITAPGIRISAKALWEDTAKLPEIEIRKPKTILAQDTITSMQAGLIYGQIGQTEYIIRQVRKETGCGEMKVVATGGLGRIISDETDMIDKYDSTLTLKGLKILYERNKK